MQSNFTKSAKKYWTIWSKVASYALAETFVSRWTNFFFLFGKAVRVGISLLILFLLQQNIQQIAGYSIDQVIIFFLTYQFLDTVAQIFFRGVYLFSWQVRSGELDFYLAKPINPLFRILTGKPDILDAFFLVPTTILSFWIAANLNITVTWESFLLFVGLMINGFLILTGLHILVICLGIVTTEVDNAVMLYRDINHMARFPIDMYKEPLRTILYFIVPVGIVNTIPAQVLLNLKPGQHLLIATMMGTGFLLFSLWMWKLSVKKYTSAGG